jgi:hypothetical protein
MSIQGKEEGSEVPDVRVSVYKERRQTALTLHGENIRADSNGNFFLLNYRLTRCSRYLKLGLILLDRKTHGES